MQLLISIVAFMGAALVVDAAMAQQSTQQYVMLPLTDWRALVDADISKLSLPRDAHAALFTIMQSYERQAQIERARQMAPAVDTSK